MGNKTNYQNEKVHPGTYYFIHSSEIKRYLRKRTAQYDPNNDFPNEPFDVPRSLTPDELVAGIPIPRVAGYDNFTILQKAMAADYDTMSGPSNKEITDYPGSIYDI